MEVEMNEENFDSEVLSSSIPFLVDFWAPWCVPCKTVSPIVTEIGEEKEGKLKVGKLNLDEAPNIAARYGIMSIPTLILFKSGKEVTRFVGAVPKEKLLREIEKYL